jgi:BirA family biotin operon repressor/biotin-[acetyl-CoA-carboxylase] ligase
LPLTPVNHSLGTPFVELQSIDSTNNYALAQIHANLAQPGTCYFAHEQTAGKGQRGKSWVSEKDSNITLTIVLNPFPLQTFQQFYLSACVAVATQQFLRNFAGELTIKWPNDIYWKDKKLGGILIENVIGPTPDHPGQAWENQILPGSSNQPGSGPRLSTWKWAIIGVGINVNQEAFAEEIKNPVSLKQITKERSDTVQLAVAFCKTLGHFYKKLQEDPDSILDLYNRVLYKKNELVRFKKGNRNFQSIVKSVNEAGQLIVQHSIEERIDFGEVEWVIEEVGGS